MKLTTRLHAELATSLIVGGTPAAVMLSLSGVEGLVAFVNAAVAPGPVVWVYFSLTFLFCPLILYVAHSIHPDSRRSRYAGTFCADVVRESATSLLAVYRVVAGVLLVSLAAWFAFERSTLTGDAALRIGGVAVASLFTATALSWWQEQMTWKGMSTLRKLQQSGS